jgi:hypothetical protein
MGTRLWGANVVLGWHRRSIAANPRALGEPLHGHAEDLLTGLCGLLRRIRSYPIALTAARGAQSVEQAGTVGAGAGNATITSDRPPFRGTFVRSWLGGGSP